MGSSRRALVAAGLLALSGAGITLGATPAAAANVCGGDASDFTGVTGALTPFTGNVVGAGVIRPITVTPIQLGGSAMKAEITINTDVRSATGVFSLRTDALGRGHITFPVFKGSGVSDSLACTGVLQPTRVTAIAGLVAVSDADILFPFTVTRAAL